MFFSVIFLSFVFLFAASFITQKLATPKNLPPSPPALPVIGHLHLVKEPDVHRTLDVLSKKFGPIFSLRFGTRNVLVVSSAEAAEECLKQNDLTFANRPQNMVGKHMNYNYSSVGFASYGDYWRGLRRLTATEIFSTTRLNALSSIWGEEVRRMLKQLVIASEGKQMKVEVTSELVGLVFNIMVRMIAGDRYSGVDEEARQFQGLMKEWLEIAGRKNMNDHIPLLRWVDFGGVEKRMKRGMEKMDKFLEHIVEESRKMRNQREDKGRDGNTLIHVMLSKQEVEPDFYTNETIKAVILSMLIAGIETTTTTLVWAIALLLNNPDKLDKVWSEIEANIGHQKLLDVADLSKLNYLNGCISETMRLFPAVPLLLPHEAAADCTVGGYSVAQGTMLLVNLWSIHRDPNAWEDAESFIPERFESGKNNGYKFIPFSAGRRKCPGEALAAKVMGVALGSMVQAFEWKRVGEEAIEMKEHTGITIPKAEPLEALCVPRPGMVTLYRDI